MLTILGFSVTVGAWLRPLVVVHQRLRRPVFLRVGGYPGSRVPKGLEGLAIGFPLLDKVHFREMKPIFLRWISFGNAGNWVAMRDEEQGTDQEGGPEKSGSLKNRVPKGVVLVALLVLALAGSGVTSGLIGGIVPGQDQMPKPFDPPTSLERALAAETALQDVQVGEQLGERYVHLDTALRTEKRPGVPVSEHPRLFDVWFYNYDDDVVVWAVVDPVRGEVIEMIPVDSPLYPPLAEVEVDRALEIAFGLELLTERFPEVPQVAAMLVSGEGTTCPVNRCVALAFVEDASWEVDLVVLVNLSIEKVVRVAEGHWEEVVRQ